MLASSNILKFQSVVQENHYAWPKMSNLILSKAVTVIHSSRNQLYLSCPPWIFSFMSSVTLLDSSLIPPEQNTAWDTRCDVWLCPIMCHFIFHLCDIIYWHLEKVNLNREKPPWDLACNGILWINNLSGSTQTTVHVETPEHAKQDTGNMPLSNIPLL